MLLHCGLLSGSRWILDQLAALCRLVSENVHQLLDSISRTARKVRVSSKTLLQRICLLLLTHTPSAVSKSMVDFNRWLVEVLADTRSEGIQWQPSYSEHPWLALEALPENPPLEEDIAIDDAHTTELLRTMAEYYMVRCESLLNKNANLTTQVNELKEQLSNTLARLFESQQIAERQQELMDLQGLRLVMGVRAGDFLANSSTDLGAPSDVPAQITRAFGALDVIVLGADEETASESDRDEEDGQDNLVQTEETTLEIDTLDQEEAVSSAVVDSDYSTLALPTDSEQDSEGSASAVVASESTPISGELSYQQLTELRSCEEDEGSWARRTLQALKEQRKQRRADSEDATETRSSIDSTSQAVPTTPPHLIRSEPLEYDRLVAMREQNDGGEDSSWYRVALHHLKQERQRRASYRTRAESFSSTITIVD